MKKIMLVEDNFDILFNLKLILENHKFIVEQASDGNIALNMILSDGFMPDLIISDVLMPNLNGFELLDKIYSYKEYSNIPFIFLTSLSEVRDIRHGIKLGATDYLIKPIEEEELINTVNKKIEKKLISDELIKKVKEDLLIFEEDYGKLKSLKNNEIFLILILWNDIYGPKIEKIYPQIIETYPFSLDKISSQLFNALKLLYGFEGIDESETLLVNLKNLNLSGYLYLDSYPSPHDRFKKKIFMIAIIAPKINYLQTFILKDILKEISQEYQIKKDINIKDYWNKIRENFSAL